MKNKITSHLAWRNKHLIVTLSLAVALIYTYFPIEIENEAVAYKQEKKPTKFDAYELDLEIKAITKYQENFAVDMRKAYTEVLMEENTRLQEKALEIPTKDWEAYKQIIEALEITN